MSSDLAEFLLARIADDEVIAQDAAERDGAEAWHWVSGDAWDAVNGPHYEGLISAELVSEAEFVSPRTDFDLPVLATTGGPTEIRWPAAAHIAHWDPARVLAECEAKRRIIGEHSPADFDRTFCRVCSPIGERFAPFPCETLRLLALPHADHPGYRPEWRV